MFATLLAIAGTVHVSAACPAAVQADDRTGYALKQVDQGTHSVSTDQDRLVAAAFERFGRALKVPDGELKSPRIGEHGNFVLALTDAWLYRIDIAGNQAFRPISNLPAMKVSLSHPADPSATRVDTSEFVSQARDLAEGLGFSLESLPSIAAKKEFLVTLPRVGGAPTFFSGRVLIRFVSLDNKAHFQVQFDDKHQPLRIDTNVPSESGRQLQTLLQKGLATAPIPALIDTSSPYVVGTFFDPGEYRFEFGSTGFESMQFCDIRSARNPFLKGNFDDLPSKDIFLDGTFNANRDNYFVDGAAWQKTQDCKFYEWMNWDEFARMGGARGNWDKSTGAWQRPNVSVIHRNLGSYRFAAGEPTQTRAIKFFDGKPRQVPFAVHQQLESKFSEDLESCSVAALATHGGPVEDRLEFRKGFDMWFQLGDPRRPLGSGKLRTLMLFSCGTMNCFQEGDRAKFLFTNWLSGDRVRGLSIACGYDGGAGTGGNNGNRFFHGYNQGDAIIDAWINGGLGETYENNPVIVAYGGTQSEAIASLADQRFSTQNVQPGFAIASAWKPIKN